MLTMLARTVKFSKNLDLRIMCCNHPRFQAEWLYPLEGGSSVGGKIPWDASDTEMNTHTRHILL